MSDSTDAVKAPSASFFDFRASSGIMLRWGAGSGATPGQANLQYSSVSQTSLDNNSVDMDRERASFVDNAVKYEATLRFINGNVRTMLDAIKGQS